VVGYSNGGDVVEESEDVVAHLESGDVIGNRTHDASRLLPNRRDHLVRPVQPGQHRGERDSCRAKFYRHRTGRQGALDVIRGDKGCVVQIARSGDL
jgi:hypothetical protein